MTASKPEGRLLSRTSYNSLLSHIAALLESANATSSDAKLSATWEIGRHIRDARLSEKAGYHNGVIRDLAADSGVSARVLQEAVTFHDAYRSAPLGTPLNWSHYRQLMRLPKAERPPFVAQAKKQSWTARELSAALLSARQEGAASATGPLKRPTDPTFLYGASVTNIVDGDTLDVAIDLGFQVTRHQRLRLAHIDTPPLTQKAGRAARDYLQAALHQSHTIVVTTLRVDLHGRYVTHLFESPEALSILDCFQTGRHLNQALLKAGHAIYRPQA